MVVDTSALVVILLGEPDAELFAHALDMTIRETLAAAARHHLTVLE